MTIISFWLFIILVCLNLIAWSIAVVFLVVRGIANLFHME